MTVSKEDLFTGKTNEYDRFRPQYPNAIFAVFEMHTKPKSNVADIGAGTGYLTLPLLKTGHTVNAIEPNDDMRKTLDGKVKSVRLSTHDANAQSTGLDTQSVDVITMGNVAHWLDGNAKTHNECLVEFNRILKSDGKIAVFSLSPTVKNRWISDIFNLAQKYDPSFDIPKIERSFSDHGFHARNFMDGDVESGYSQLSQKMNQSDFYDFMISHSFCDDRMRDEIETIFNKHSKSKVIDVEFSSSVYIGSLKPA